MLTLRRILVTTDFSVNARKAYACAAHLAHEFGATIYLAHFGHLHAPAYSGISDEDHVSGLCRALSEEARYGALANIPVKTHFLKRRCVAESLQLFERDVCHDLVVTNTSGRTGWQRFVQGNFAEQIVAHTSVPILMWGPSIDACDAVESKLVLVPFDFSDAALRLVPAVRFLATHYGCAFKFLFVYEAHPKRIGLCEKMWKGIASRTETTEQRFAELKQSELSSIDVEFESCQGTPAVEIVHRARDMEADLIVIGTHRTQGTVAQKVCRDAYCPVLAVPSKTSDKHG